MQEGEGHHGGGGHLVGEGREGARELVGPNLLCVGSLLRCNIVIQPSGSEEAMLRRCDVQGPSTWLTFDQGQESYAEPNFSHIMCVIYTRVEICEI